VVDSVWLFSRNRSAFSACVCVNGVVAGRNNRYLIGRITSDFACQGILINWNLSN